MKKFASTQLEPQDQRFKVALTDPKDTYIHRTVGAETQVRSGLPLAAISTMSRAIDVRVVLATSALAILRIEQHQRGSKVEAGQLTVHQ